MINIKIFKPRIIFWILINTRVTCLRAGTRRQEHHNTPRKGANTKCAASTKKTTLRPDSASSRHSSSSSLQITAQCITPPDKCLNLCRCWVYQFKMPLLRFISVSTNKSLYFLDSAIRQCYTILYYTMLYYTILYIQCYE